MRTFLFKLIFFSAILLLAGVSCTKDKAVFGNHLGNVIRGNLQADRWNVTYFISSGEDMTHQFSASHFLFKNDGVLTASNLTKTFNGTWELTSCECNSGDLENLELSISFEGSNIFKLLNNTWNFVSQSTVKIELVAKKGGNGNDDYLTIERV